VLFGGVAATPPAPAPPGSNQKHADTLFGGDAAPVVPGADPNAPPAPAGASTTSPLERELYGLGSLETGEPFPVRVAMRETFSNRRHELSDVLGLSHEQQHARHNEWAIGIRETGLDPTIGALIYNKFTDAEVAIARGADVDDATLAAANKTIRQRLRETYGEEAEDLLKRTNTFVNAHPKLAAVIGMRGVGSNPEVALELVEFVRRSHIK
jgi:hypothetical protein